MRTTGVDAVQPDVFVSADIGLTVQDAPDGCAKDDTFDLVAAEITGDGRKATTVGDVYLGSDNDDITVTKGADTGLIDGGSGHDTLKVAGGPFDVTWAKGGPEGGAGTITFTDDAGEPTGKEIQFREIEAITCFTSGTLILTPRGEIPIDALTIGDRVITRDHGVQPIRWIGKTTVQAEGDLAPIAFAPGAFGNSEVLHVSPQHRMLLSGWRCDMVAGTKEALAPAKHLAELLRLFPDVRIDTRHYGPAARPQVKPYEARLIRP